MSFVLTAPGTLVEAASNLAGIGSTIDTANAAAATPTTGVLPAAADEVSAQISALFSRHGQAFQHLSAQAATFHQQFVQGLTASANAYANAEANAAQTLANALSKPAETLLGNGIGSLTAGGGGPVGDVVSNALNHIEGALLGNSSAGLLGTAGLGHLTGAGALLNPAAMTNAAAGPAVNPFTPIRDAIRWLYPQIEPFVRSGFAIAHIVTRFIPFAHLVPVYQLYDFFEKYVRGVLFTSVELAHYATPSVLEFVATANATASQFLNNQTLMLRSLLPPLASA